MFAGQLAFVTAAMFTGAAVYVSFVEHPARMALDDGASVICQLIGKEPEAWQCGDRVAAYAFVLPRNPEKSVELLCYGFAPAMPEDMAESK